MQAGSIASAYRRSGRHLRLITVVAGLALTNLWLWVRLVHSVTSDGGVLTGETLIATAATTASLIAILVLWRTPLRPTITTAATPAARHAVATHHAGHVVAMHLKDPGRIGRVTMSDACTLPPTTVPAVTETSLREDLAITLSGMSAEEIFAGESGTHAAADLARATTIGADMVGRFGMSGSLVSLATSRTRRGKFIDKVLDDARTRKELEALLRDSKRDSMRNMLENRHLIIALRDALVRRDSLSAEDIRRIIGEAENRRMSDDEVLVDLRSAGERSRPLLGASKL